MRISNRWFTLYKEKPGVISEGPCWVCLYGCWMHIELSPWKLLWSVLTEFRSDKHLIG